MSKATLEFTLPDEKDEFDQARNGSALAGAIWAYDQKLRNAIKYANRDELQDARDWLWEELKDRSVADIVV